MAEEVRLVALYQDPLERFRVALRSDGLLCYFASDAMVINLEVCKEIFRGGLAVTDRPRPTLVLMQNLARVDRQAREFFNSDEYLQVASQSALVVGSPVSRVVGSFFLGLNRVKYPARLFTDPNLAVSWLRGFLT